MELLPPTIEDPELLALVGDLLSVRPTPAAASALRLRLMRPDFSWQALVDLAKAQGLIPPLIHALKTRGLLLPTPRTVAGAQLGSHPTTQLEASYRQHLARQQDLRDQLERILVDLNAVGVFPLVLKGARYLIAPVGSWCEARAMRDIDLLVRPADVGRAVEALEGLGYAFDGSFVPIDQHLPEMWCPGRHGAIEIHIEALSFAGRKILTTEEVWAHAARLGTGSCYVLPVEWHLLHGMLHHQISDRAHARRTLAIKGLWEFAKLGNELSDESWRSIATHLEAKGGSEVLGSWLVLAQRLFGLDPPAHVAISNSARAHAEKTFRRVGAPYWLRRVPFLADQVRFGFARETLAVRYGISQAQVSLKDRGRHLAFLVRRYRGAMLRRLAGRGDRLP